MGFLGLATIRKTCKMVSRVCEGESEDERGSGTPGTRTGVETENVDSSPFYQGPTQFQVAETDTPDEMVMLQQEYLTHLHQVQERERLAWEENKVKRAKSKSRCMTPASSRANTDQACSPWQGVMTGEQPPVAYLVQQRDSELPQTSPLHSGVPWCQTGPSVYTTSLLPGVAAIDHPTEMDPESSPPPGLTYPLDETCVEYSPPRPSFGRLTSPLLMRQNVSRLAGGIQEYVLWQPAIPEVTVSPYKPITQLGSVGEQPTVSLGVRTGEQTTPFSYAPESQYFGRATDTAPSQLLPAGNQASPVVSNSADGPTGLSSSDTRFGPKFHEPCSSTMNPSPPSATWDASADQTPLPWSTYSPLLRATPDTPQRIYQYRFEPTTWQPLPSGTPLASTSFSVSRKSSSTVLGTLNQGQNKPFLACGRRELAGTDMLRQQAPFATADLPSRECVGTQPRRNKSMDVSVPSAAGAPEKSQSAAGATSQGQLQQTQMDDSVSPVSQFGMHKDSLSAPDSISERAKLADKAAIRRAAAEIREKLRVHRCKSHETVKSSFSFPTWSLLGPMKAKDCCSARPVGQDGGSHAVSKPVEDTTIAPGKHGDRAQTATNGVTRDQNKTEACRSEFTASALAASLPIISGSRCSVPTSTTPHPKTEFSSAVRHISDNAQRSPTQPHALQHQENPKTVVRAHSEGLSSKTTVQTNSPSLILRRLQESLHAESKTTPEKSETGVGYPTTKPHEISSAAKDDRCLIPARDPQGALAENHSLFNEKERQKQQFLELAARLWDESRSQEHLTCSRLQESPYRSAESPTVQKILRQASRQKLSPKSCYGPYTRLGGRSPHTDVRGVRKETFQGSFSNRAADLFFPTTNDNSTVYKLHANSTAHQQLTKQPGDDRKETTTSGTGQVRGATDNGRQDPRWPGLGDNPAVHSCAEQSPTFLAQRLPGTSCTMSPGNGLKLRSLSTASLSDRLSNLHLSYSLHARERISHESSSSFFGRQRVDPNETEADKQAQQASEMSSSPKLPLPIPSSIITSTSSAVTTSVTPSTTLSDALPSAVSPQSVHPSECTTAPIKNKDEESYPISRQSSLSPPKTPERSQADKESLSVHGNTIHSSLVVGDTNREQQPCEKVYDSRTSPVKTSSSSQQRSPGSINSADISPAPKCFESSAGVTGPLNRDNHPRAGGERQKNSSDDGFLSDDSSSVNMKKTAGSIFGSRKGGSSPDKNDDSNLLTFFSAPAELSSLSPTFARDRIVSSSPCASEDLGKTNKKEGSPGDISFIPTLGASTYTFSSPEDGISWDDGGDGIALGQKPGKCEMYWSQSDPVEYSTESNREDNDSTDIFSFCVTKKRSLPDSATSSMIAGREDSLTLRGTLYDAGWESRKQLTCSDEEDDRSTKHQHSMSTQQDVSHHWNTPSSHGNLHGQDDLSFTTSDNRILRTSFRHKINRSPRSTSTVLRLLRRAAINESHRKMGVFDKDEHGGRDMDYFSNRSCTSSSSSPASVETTSKFKEFLTYDSLDNHLRGFSGTERKNNTSEEGAYDDDEDVGHAKLLSCADTPESCSMNLDCRTYVDVDDDQRSF
ncbi:hypothetical protein CSUI_007083 [Cystoisospora suis]|uniref:Uncharacterized protein n=1 Tax=Cystoisospora suis TaxID=483139 RepID=A0A2C6KRA2_9APIC|nr:hypothetical protein CSUI_007083 [Cystoisospora suis]